MEHFPVISLLIAIPFISSMIIGALVKNSVDPHTILYSKYVAVMSSVFTLFTSIVTLLTFNINNNKKHNIYKFQEYYEFLPIIGLDIELGLDGISIFFIFLAALLTLISIVISMYSVSKNIKEFLVCFLLLESFIIGAFASTNLLLFYIFFEAILIPIFLIIGIAGGKNRVYASTKLFIYTFFGSVFFMAVLVYLFLEFGTLSMPQIQKLAKDLPYNIQLYLWIGAFIAFGIKIPVIPFHTWLPDAHVEAPTSGSVMLAGLLLKVGAYGFIRILLQIFPQISFDYAEFVRIISIIAIIYGSFVAISQTNMKKMVAYSSIAHMGYVTSAIFSFNNEGLSGAITQMISHGIISPALFIIVGFLYDRIHTKEISEYGGVSQKMPILSVFFMIFTLASIGLPGTSGFVGEFTSLVGIYKSSIYAGIFSSLGVIVGAIYMLRLYRDTMLGEIKNQKIASLKDLTIREIICLLPLALLTIVIGLYPVILTQFYDGEISIILNQINSLK
ncbi:MAG: NADH-quinone oxidoreductase subunit M [Rickettsiaceae bacterium]|nr:NADH-quinone oxidoreductase subunit M [Rickettsiaceae bacterium]